MNRLRGGRRTMRDEDEDETSEEEDETEEDEDDEDDEESEGESEGALSETESETAVDEDEDDYDDEDEEELPSASPRRHKKAASRDELPRTVRSSTERHALTTATGAQLAPGQLLEPRDGSEPAGPIILTLDAPAHVSEQTKALQSMRRDNVLTDVHVVCKSGAKLPAHRVLLAAASPQLRGMLQALAPAAAPEQPESKTPTKGRGAKGGGGGGGDLVLEEVDEACATALLDFVYTGSVTVLEDHLPVRRRSRGFLFGALEFRSSRGRELANARTIFLDFFYLGWALFGIRAAEIRARECTLSSRTRDRVHAELLRAARIRPCIHKCELVLFCAGVGLGIEIL